MKNINLIIVLIAIVLIVIFYFQYHHVVKTAEGELVAKPNPNYKGKEGVLIGPMTYEYDDTSRIKQINQARNDFLIKSGITIVAAIGIIFAMKAEK